MHWWLLFFTALQFNISPEPLEQRERIRWMSVSDVEQAFQREPRPILMYMHTSWCGWCRKMERSTFRHSGLVRYVNEHYYAVSFDGEYRQPVTFNGKTYRYQASEKIHELTLYLTRGEPAFPTIVFLNGPEGNPSPLAGYLTAKQLEPPLKYFVQQPTVSFETFLNSFKYDW